jgi:hypothetical protein
MRTALGSPLCGLWGGFRHPTQLATMDSPRPPAVGRPDRDTPKGRCLTAAHERAIATERLPGLVSTDARRTAVIAGNVQMLGTMRLAAQITTAPSTHLQADGNGF